MPLVNVMVNGRAYTLACDAGEEQHLKELASHVDGKVKELLASIGQTGDQRMLLMAALLIADEVHEARTRAETLEKELADIKNARDALDRDRVSSEEAAANVLVGAAKRLEDVAAVLSRA